MSRAASEKRTLSTTNLPSYIPAANFAVALLQVVARPGTANSNGNAVAGPPSPLTVASLQEAVNRLENDSVREVLGAAINGAGDDLGRVQANVEAWFNSSMDRVSGWYKRRTHQIVFVIGCAMAVVLNVNSLKIADHLSTDVRLREALVADAQRVIANGPPQTPADVEAQYRQLKGLHLPIGWANTDPRAGWAKKDMNTANWLWWYVVWPVLGWAIAAFAVSLGAPFWFDVLNKFMVVRSTVKPHEKSPVEGSEDRKGGQARMPRLSLGGPGGNASSASTN